MASPPNRSSFAATLFTGLGATATIGGTVNTGDLVIIMSVGADAASPVNTPPAITGATFIELANLGSTASEGRICAWYARADSGGGVTATVSRPSSNVQWGAFAWVYRNHNGIGKVATALAKTTDSVILPRSGANSALLFGSSDWNGITGTRTRRTINSSTGVEEGFTQQAGVYSAYAIRYDNGGNPAPTGQEGGNSAPGSTKSNVVGVEILSASGSPGPELVMAFPI